MRFVSAGEPQPDLCHKQILEREKIGNVFTCCTQFLLDFFFGLIFPKFWRFPVFFPVTRKEIAA